MRVDYPDTYQPYDELQVSRDGGKTWSDYYTIRELDDARGAKATVICNREQNERYRIVRRERGQWETIYW